MLGNALGSILGNQVGNSLSGDIAPSFAAINSIFGFAAGAGEVWDANRDVGLVGGVVDTWLGQVNALSLAAPASGNRCAYSAANALFNNQPTIATDFTTPTYLRATSGVAAAIGWNAGTLIYMSAVVRQTRATPSFNETSVDVLSVGNASISWFRTSSSTQLNQLAVSATTGSVSVSRTTPITATHLIESELDAALFHSYIDGIDSTVAAVGGLTGTATQVIVGAGSAGGGTPGANEIAAIIIGKNVSGATKTAWRAYCTSRWGKP